MKRRSRQGECKVTILPLLLKLIRRERENGIFSHMVVYQGHGEIYAHVYILQIGHFSCYYQIINTFETLLQIAPNYGLRSLDILT